jgi:hypothetical protein
MTLIAELQNGISRLKTAGQNDTDPENGGGSSHGRI